MNKPIVSIQDVTKSYADQKPVLHQVSIDVQKGEVVSILGKSGCGKSTLLNCIGGFEAVQKGQILLDGEIVKKPSKRCMMLMQNYGLLPWRSVRKNVELGLEHSDLTKQAIEERVTHYIDMVGLADRAGALPQT